MDILKEYRFDDLAIPQRAALLSLEGTYLARRSLFCFVVSLYSIDDSFVEVWYNFYTDDVQFIELLAPTKIPDYYPNVVELTAHGVTFNAEKQGRDFLLAAIYSREERWESDKLWSFYIGPYGREGPTLHIKADTLRYRFRRRYLTIRRYCINQFRNIIIRIRIF